MRVWTLFATMIISISLSAQNTKVDLGEQCNLNNSGIVCNTGLKCVYKPYPDCYGKSDAVKGVCAKLVKTEGEECCNLRYGEMMSQYGNPCLAVCDDNSDLFCKRTGIVVAPGAIQVKYICSKKLKWKAECPYWEFHNKNLKYPERCSIIAPDVCESGLKCIPNPYPNNNLSVINNPSYSLLRSDSGVCAKVEEEDGPCCDMSVSTYCLHICDSGLNCNLDRARNDNYVIQSTWSCSNRVSEKTPGIIYPNPFHDHDQSICLKDNNVVRNKTKIVIADTLGKIVQVVSSPEFGGCGCDANEACIRINSMAPGAYFFTVTSGNYKHTYKVMKAAI